MTDCVGPSMIVGKPCLNGPEGPHLDLDGEHEYQPAVVVPSAVLGRDCDACDGTGTYRVEVSTPPPEDSGDYPCEAPGCVNGRVRGEFLVRVEPDEVERLRKGLMEELHWGLDGIICPDLMEMTDRILALLGVKEEK